MDPIMLEQQVGRTTYRLRRVADGYNVETDNGLYHDSLHTVDQVAAVSCIVRKIEVSRGWDAFFGGEPLAHMENDLQREGWQDAEREALLQVEAEVQEGREYSPWLA
jgi:hypothetical protein